MVGDFGVWVIWLVAGCSCEFVFDSVVAVAVDFASCVSFLVGFFLLVGCVWLDWCCLAPGADFRLLL